MTYIHTYICTRIKLARCARIGSLWAPLGLCWPPWAPLWHVYVSHTGNRVLYQASWGSKADSMTAEKEADDLTTSST